MFVNSLTVTFVNVSIAPFHHRSCVSLQFTLSHRDWLNNMSHNASYYGDAYPSDAVVAFVHCAEVGSNSGFSSVAVIKCHHVFFVKVKVIIIRSTFSLSSWDVTISTFWIFGRSHPMHSLRRVWEKRDEKVETYIDPDLVHHVWQRDQRRHTVVVEKTGCNVRSGL